MRRDNLLARSRRGGSLPEVQSLRRRRARAPTPTDRDPASSSTSPTRAARASRADNSANSSYTILASEVSATRARWARDTRCSTSARDAEACRESHTPCGATNPRRARSATSRGRATSRATTTPRGEYIRTTRRACRWRTRPTDGARETSGSPGFERFEGTKAAGKGDETKGVPTRVPTGRILSRSEGRARGVAPSSGPRGCSAGRDDERARHRATPDDAGAAPPPTPSRRGSRARDWVDVFWFADAFAIARD